MIASRRSLRESSSDPGCAPSSLSRRVATAGAPTRGSSGTSRTSPRPSATGTATLSRGSTASRVSASVPLVSQRRSRGLPSRSPSDVARASKVFTMTRTARRRDGAGSTRREISRVRVPRPLCASMRAAPRGGVLGSRARRSPRVPGDASHAGCFIRVFAYRRDAFLVFWSFDTDPFVPPRLHSPRPLASSSRSTTLVSLSTSRRTSASLRMSPSSPPSVFATRSPVSPRTS